MPHTISVMFEVFQCHKIVTETFIKYRSQGHSEKLWELEYINLVSSLQVIKMITHTLCETAFDGWLFRLRPCKNVSQTIFIKAHAVVNFSNVQKFHGNPDIFTIVCCQQTDGPKHKHIYYNTGLAKLKFR